MREVGMMKSSEVTVVVSSHNVDQLKEFMVDHNVDQLKEFRQ